MKFNQFIKVMFVAVLLLAFPVVQAKGGLDFHNGTFDYGQRITDMRVKVLGGEVKITRKWSGAEWVWNGEWNAPVKINDLAISRGRATYIYMHMDGEYMSFEDKSGNRILTKPWHIPDRTPEVIWVSKGGHRILFEDFTGNRVNENGEPYYFRAKIVSYQYRSGPQVKFTYSPDGKLQHIKDHFDNTIYTYTWQSDLIREIVDYTGRKVSYDYNATGGLIKVVDVLGQEWIYDKDTQTDPEGNKIAFKMFESVKKHSANKRVAELAYSNGYSIVKESQYEKKESRGYTTEKHSSGLFIETWSDPISGLLQKKYINGDLLNSYEYTFSKEAPKTAGKLTATDLRYAAGQNGEKARDDVKANAEYCVLTGGLPRWNVDRPTPASGGGSSYVQSPQFLGCSDKYFTLLSPGDTGYAHEKSIVDKKNLETPIERRNPDPVSPSSYIKTKIESDARGNKTVYYYDQWKNETQVDYPNGTSISRTWHSKYDFPLTETNEKGIVTAYEYDDKGNLLTLIEAKGTVDERITRYTYDQYGQVKTVTTGESAANNTALATTSYEYDEYGNVIQVTDPEGNITLYGDYDVLGNAKTVTDARANDLPDDEQYTWKTTYDAAGNVLKNEDPYGKGEIYTYDKAGNLESLTSASGSKVVLANNALGQPLTMMDDNGKVTKIEYDKAGRLTLVTDANGNRAQTIYDAKGNLQRTIDGEGNSIQLNYTEGLLRSIQYPRHKELLSYDNRNRVKQTTQQGNGRNYIRKRDLDPSGNLIGSVDAQENATAYEYDALNRVTKMIDAEGGVTEFTYDARDSLLQVKDPEGRLTIYTYNKNDHLLTETKDGDQNTNRLRRYDYDQNGNLISIINPEQEKTTYEFDQANRLAKARVFANKDHAHPIKVINYQLNEKNHLVGWSQQASINLPEGVTPTADIIPLSETYSYNNLEQLESVAVDFGGFTKTYSYSYYPNGLKKTYTNPEGITYTYYYNKNNQLMAVHIPGEGQISYGSFDWLMPQTILLPGGQRVSLKYNDFQQLKEQVLKKGNSEELAKAVYEYDFEQNITKIEKGEGIFNYGYDDLYRLTTVDSPEDYEANDETFHYDGVGNRVERVETRAEDGNINESQHYNLKNQLQTIDSSVDAEDTAYTYNVNGHTKTKTTNGVATEYIYNHEERLIKVNRDGVTIADYVYNSQGQRVKKTVNGIATWYLYNQNGLAAEYGSTGQLIKEYHFHPLKTWMTDPLFMRTATGSYYYYHNDHLGTPQQLLDATGQVVWAAQYSVFGKAIIITDIVESNLRFPGQYYDHETQLHHNYFRDYDPATGRYIQSDPLKMDSSVNYYIYAQQNPLIHVDPTGEIALSAGGFVIGAALDIAIQLAVNGMRPECIKWDVVLIAAVAGALNPFAAGSAASTIMKGEQMAARAQNRRAGSRAAKRAGQKANKHYQNGWAEMASWGAVEGGAEVAGNLIPDDKHWRPQNECDPCK